MTEIGDVIGLNDIVIDAEFKDLIPPLTGDEFEQLKINVLREGKIREPLSVWHNEDKDEFVLIDGHNRYEIAQQYNIIPTIRLYYFSDWYEAHDWIIDNQLGRRNVTENQKSYLRGKRYKSEKKKIGENQFTSSKNGVVNVATPQKTSEKLAGQYKVGERTIRNDEKFAEDIDVIRGVNKDLAHNILNKTVDLTRNEVELLAQTLNQNTLTFKDEKEVLSYVRQKNQAKKAKNQAHRQALHAQAQELNELESIDNQVIEKLNVQIGEWWQLGKHLLYCGDSSQPEFHQHNFVRKFRYAFAFADPPYNTQLVDWDKDFIWQHDYLNDIAPIIAVTPGTIGIHTFHQTTQMPYRWAMACWISNGMSVGKLGYANWIYTALFGKGKLFQYAQDFWKITIDNSENEDTKHFGRKPYSFMAHLLDLFTAENEYVLDPFVGSGTTLLMCEKMNRRCVGAEIQPEFCQEIIQRYEKLSGIPAHKL